MPFVDVDGIRLHVELDGPDDAPLVLFLHGALAAGAAFRSQRVALRERFRLAFADQRGHGRSTHFGEPGCPWEGVAIERYARDAHALLDALSPDAPAHLVGASMGGLVAARVTAERPERVASLALLGSSGAPSARRREYFSTVTPDTLPKGTRQLAALWHGEPYWRDLARHLFAYFAAAGDERWPARVAPPRALVMQARDDEILDPREWEAWVARLDAPVTVERPPGDHAFFADGRAGSRAANAALRAHLRA